MHILEIKCTILIKILLIFASLGHADHNSALVLELALRRLWNKTIARISGHLVIYYTLVTSGYFYNHGLTLIPTCISNHMLSRVWCEITYPFLNFNGNAVEVWERIYNFIPHFIMDVITYTCWDWS